MEKKQGTRVYETKVQKLVAGLGMPASSESGKDTQLKEQGEELQQLQKRFDKCEKVASTLLDQLREEEQRREKIVAQLREKEE